MVDVGSADMIPVDEVELAAAVDVGIVPYDAFICGERVLRFSDVAWRLNKRDAILSICPKRVRTSRARFV